MPPAIIDALTNYRAALLARETAQMQQMAQRWLGVEQALQAQVDALALEMRNMPSVVPSQIMRSRRYRALMEQTRDEMRRYAAYMEGTITAGQRNMIADAVMHSAQAINTVATESGMIVQFNRLPVSSVNGMAGLAGDGSPLRDILADASRVGPDALGQELINGIALGRNPLDVARRAMRNGLAQSFTRMATISRTEMLRTYRSVTQTAYESSNVVVGYVRLSARDSRTCAGCLMADGRRYPLGTTFESHVNCRCSMIPILRNVPAVRFETGQEWFRQQPESTQRAILGTGRYTAWRNGRATLDDMVSVTHDDTWGDAVVPTLVRDLTGGNGG